MEATADMVRQHYSKVENGSNLLANVNQILESFGDAPVTTSRLASLERFHVRGLPATVELAELAAIQPSSRVLDAGSGLGCPSRYIAEHYGCSIIGVDLTPSFVAVSQLLADRTSLKHLVTYEVGNLTVLSFPAAHFDLVWTQHVVMNLSDRSRVYQRIPATNYCPILGPALPFSPGQKQVRSESLTVHFCFPHLFRLVQQSVNLISIDQKQIANLASKYVNRAICTSSLPGSNLNT